MPKEKDLKINFLRCDDCDSAGVVNNKRCTTCKGLGFGVYNRGVFLYWDKRLDLVSLLTEKIEKTVKKTIDLVLILFGVIGFISLLTVLYNISQRTGPETNDLYFWRYKSGAMLLFWVSLIGDMYYYFRVLRKKYRQATVQVREYKQDEYTSLPVFSWAEVLKLKKDNKINIADVFSGEAISVIEKAWKIALRKGHTFVMPVHLLSACFDSKKSALIFARLGVAPKAVERRIESVYKSFQRGIHIPSLQTDVVNLFFYAYFEAYEAHKETVGVPEILLGLISKDNNALEILYDLEIDIVKLRNVVAWININQKLRDQWKMFRKKASIKPKSGMDRAMTAVATPYLNNFSEDITAYARAGYLEPCIAREQEIEEIFRIMEGGTQSVILVGSVGVGTTSIVNGIAGRMVEETVPEVLQDKRLVKLKVSSLVAGAGDRGEIEQRLNIIASEIALAGNIVLFIDNIHNMIGLQSGEGSTLDISDQLAEYLSRRVFMAIATTTPIEYTRVIERSSLPSVFSKVDIDEMEENQAIWVAEAKAGGIEFKNNVYFTYDAISRCVTMTKRFIHDDFLPSKAIKVLEEVATYVRNIRGESSIVTGEDVAEIISQKVSVPVTKINASETEKLLHLEENIHARVIGQVEAVKAVSSALRRSRAELRDINRPIANFLFLGPTGVGKTELAKTVAEVFFGNEENMIRVDMSEYQQKSSVDRLIGAPGSTEGGILSEAARRNPFALVLLDELEKAHPDILNIFLQVMDDGHLTDTMGRKIDFTNTIIIATSNAGTTYIQDSIKANIPLDTIRKTLINEQLREYYRPEFLNRFDSIVVFKPLEFEEIKLIAGLMLNKVRKRLDKKGIRLEVTEQALEELAKVGFDPLFGARPLRRAIQNNVDNALAKFLLTGKIGRRDIVVLDKGGEIIIKKAKQY